METARLAAPRLHVSLFLHVLCNGKFADATEVGPFFLVAGVRHGARSAPSFLWLGFATMTLGVVSAVSPSQGCFDWCHHGVVQLGLDRRTLKLILCTQHARLQAWARGLLFQVQWTVCLGT